MIARSVRATLLVCTALMLSCVPAAPPTVTQPTINITIVQPPQGAASAKATFKAPPAAVPLPPMPLAALKASKSDAETVEILVTYARSLRVAAEEANSRLVSGCTHGSLLHPRAIP